MVTVVTNRSKYYGILEKLVRNFPPDRIFSIDDLYRIIPNINGVSLSSMAYRGYLVKQEERTSPYRTRSGRGNNRYRINTDVYLKVVQIMKKDEFLKG